MSRSNSGQQHLYGGYREQQAIVPSAGSQISPYESSGYDAYAQPYDAGHAAWDSFGYFNSAEYASVGQLQAQHMARARSSRSRNSAQQLSQGQAPPQLTQGRGQQMPARQIPSIAASSPRRAALPASPSAGRGAGRIALGAAQEHIRALPPSRQAPAGSLPSPPTARVGNVRVSQAPPASTTAARRMDPEPSDDEEDDFDDEDDFDSQDDFTDDELEDDDLEDDLPPPRQGQVPVKQRKAPARRP